MSTIRKYPSAMEKAEWKVPSLKVGEVAVVLYGFRPKEVDALFADVCCGNTTVINISKTGAITLANGYKFHANGYGFSKNGAMVISTRHVVKRNRDNTLPTDENGEQVVVPADRDGHYSTF